MHGALTARRCRAALACRRRPARRWTAARRSRCRTRSWSCGSDLQYLAARSQQGGGAAGAYPGGAGRRRRQRRSHGAAARPGVTRSRTRCAPARAARRAGQRSCSAQSADLAKQIGDLNFQHAERRRGGSAPRRAAPSRRRRGPLGSAAASRARAAASGAPRRRSSRCRRATPRWPGATTRPPRRRRARCCRAAAHAPRAYDAQFLLAQALLGQRNYQARGGRLSTTPTTARRTGARAPDALLGLANALIGAQRAAGRLRRAGQAAGRVPARRGPMCATATAAAARPRCGCR